MLVTPSPGTSRDQLLKALREQHSAVSNAWSGHHGNAQARLGAYLEWATSAVQHLAPLISPADLNRLVLTPAYDRLLAALGTVTGVDVATQRALNGLVSLELQQRVAAFEAACKALDEQIRRWSRLGAFVVADTSVYIEHEDKLENLDLAGLIDAEDELAPVHLLVPIVVVDELNGLKDKADKPYKRWRAGYTLAVFDRIFVKGTGPAVLRAAEPPAAVSHLRRRVELTAEIIFDPPGRVRLPINDDELVDRTLAIQALAGRTVTLVTFDTNQSTRARGAGLDVLKLTKPIGDEPKGR
jgi:hypothetical protein